MHPRARAGRRRRVVALAATALAGAALAPAAAHAQFPVYSKDKWVGSISEFTRPLFTQYFNQVTPENGGKWGVAAGTTRTAAMRWGQLDTAYNFAQANGFPFNFHVLLWGNQQPTWMATLPPEEQLAEIKKWFAAVAARYPDIKWLQVVNEPTWDPPDGSVPKNAGANFASSGNYVQALGGANGTDGTGYDWILNAFRLAKQSLPEHQADAQRRRHHGDDRRDGRVPEDHQHPQAREPDRRGRAPGARLRVHPQQPERPLDPGPPVRARRRTWRCTRPTSTASPPPACRSRSPSSTSTASPSTASRATRCSSPTTGGSSPPSGSTPPSRASRSGAGGSPTTGATPRTRRSCSPTTRPSPPRCGSTTTSAASLP